MAFFVFVPIGTHYVEGILSHPGRFRKPSETMIDPISATELQLAAERLEEHLRGHTGLPTLEVFPMGTELVISWPQRACWLSSMKRAVPEAYQHLVIFEPRD